MKLQTNNNQRGIALGPILFIIAVLAILAAAIAAGSGGFSASTSAESAKALAETIIQSGHAYRDAVDVVLHNGCDITALDFTPPGWPIGSTYNSGDFTGGNGTNRAGNGTCAIFDPRGGGMIFRQLPIETLMSPIAGNYSALGTTASANSDAFAGYPFFMTGPGCIIGIGTCQSTGTYYVPLILSYNDLNYAVCQKIDTLLNLSWGANSTNFVLSSISRTSYAGTNLSNSASSGYQGGYQPYTGQYVQQEGCAQDYFSNSRNAYVYSIVLYVR